MNANVRLILKQYPIASRLAGPTEPSVAAAAVDLVQLITCFWCWWWCFMNPPDPPLDIFQLFFPQLLILCANGHLSRLCFFPNAGLHNTLHCLFNYRWHWFILSSIFSSVVNGVVLAYILWTSLFTFKNWSCSCSSTMLYYSYLSNSEL